MNISLAIIPMILLTILIISDMVKALLCRDKSVIWSPLTFLVVCILYYIYMPTYKAFDLITPEAHAYMWFATLLYYISFKIGFKNSKPKSRFNKFNVLIQGDGALKTALVLFSICLTVFFIFNGFSLSFINSGVNEIAEFDENGSYSHPEQYLTNLIACFSFVVSLAYISKQKIDWKVIAIIAIAVIVYIIGGFRYRLLLLFISFFTVYHLYPLAKKINYKIVIPLFIALYALVGLMEQTRSYGHGMDADRLNEVLSGQIERQEAKENIIVYTYSAKVIEQSSVGDLLYFEPIVNAALMPIPRALFPWKPKGIYTREISWRVLGNISEGQAFCTIVEGYMSFWWFGIMLYGFALGWLSKLFWLNYSENRDKIGAILLLGLFNAMIYVIFSRGYLAQAFTQFVYYVFVPFWLVMLLRKVNILRKSS